MRWLAMLGDMGYTLLLWLNKWYNLMRARRGKTHYLNSGDWVESMTALVEDEQGEWRILRYTDVSDFLQAGAI